MSDTVSQEDFNRLLQVVVTMSERQLHQAEQLSKAWKELKWIRVKLLDGFEDDEEAEELRNLFLLGDGGEEMADLHFANFMDRIKTLRRQSESESEDES